MNYQLLVVNTYAHNAPTVYTLKFDTLEAAQDVMNTKVKNYARYRKESNSDTIITRVGSEVIIKDTLTNSYTVYTIEKF